MVGRLGGAPGRLAGVELEAGRGQAVGDVAEGGRVEVGDPAGLGRHHPVQRPVGLGRQLVETVGDLLGPIEAHQLVGGEELVVDPVASAVALDLPPQHLAGLLGEAPPPQQPGAGQLGTQVERPGRVAVGVERGEGDLGAVEIAGAGPDQGEHGQRPAGGDAEAVDAPGHRRRPFDRRQRADRPSRHGVDGGGRRQRQRLVRLVGRVPSDRGRGVAGVAEPAEVGEGQHPLPLEEPLAEADRLLPDGAVGLVGVVDDLDGPLRTAVGPQGVGGGEGGADHDLGRLTVEQRLGQREGVVGSPGHRRRQGPVRDQLGPRDRRDRWVRLVRRGPRPARRRTPPRPGRRHRPARTRRGRPPSPHRGGRSGPSPSGPRPRGAPRTPRGLPCR